jgi:hypothetical protein
VHVVAEDDPLGRDDVLEAGVEDMQPAVRRASLPALAPADAEVELVGLLVPPGATEPSRLDRWI